MSYSLKECIQIAKKEYPDLYPYAYVEKDGKYIFNLLKKGTPVDRAIADFHLVNSETGAITGSISTMLLFKDKEFRDMWQNATIIESDSKSIGHLDFFAEPGVGWAVHRKQSSELSHHGISGQRWGVRNGPPYPLDQKTHNAIVKKQDKPKEKGLFAEIFGAAMLAFSVWTVDEYINGPISRIVRRIKQNRKTNQSKELNDALIGDIAEHKDYRREQMPKTIKGEHSINDDMAAVNPNYAGVSVPGTTNNCVLCSFTYDLRRRGYDVTAKPSTEGNFDDLLMKDLYEGAHVDVLRGSDWYDIYNKAAKKYPEGARGTIGAYNVLGGGHSMAWEIHNGKLEIIDAQRNVRSSPEELALCLFDSTAEFIRTDNLKVRPEGIAKVSSELKDGWKDTVKSKNKEKAIKEIENDRSFSSKKSPKRMTKQEKIKALQTIWKREHNGTHMDAQAEEYMNNWVNANMWSMRGYEGLVLIHSNRGARFMGDNTASWGVRLSRSSSNIEHSGIKGQKWGVRRFQNEDGTLTEAGKERYYKDTDKDNSKDSRKTGVNKNGEPVISSGSHKWKAKEAETLSDEELNRRNSRLQREKQYKELTTPQWKKDTKQIFTDSLKKILVFPIVGIIAAFARTKFKDKIDPFLEKVGSKATSTIKEGKDTISRLLNPKAPHQISMDEYMKSNKG